MVFLNFNNNRDRIWIGSELIDIQGNILVDNIRESEWSGFASRSELSITEFCSSGKQTAIIGEKLIGFNSKIFGRCKITKDQIPLFFENYIDPQSILKCRDLCILKVLSEVIEFIFLLLM